MFSLSSSLAVSFTHRLSQYSLSDSLLSLVLPLSRDGSISLQSSSLTLSTVPQGGSQMLIFPLRLSREGAPHDTVTINTVFYRKQDAVDAESGGGNGSGDAMAAESR